MRNSQDQSEFNVLEFIESESAAELEWRMRYFPDGSLRYEFRDEIDRVASCRKPYGVGINESGILYIKRGYPCHVVTGPNACQKCLRVREDKRRKNFSDRIDRVDESIGLYSMFTNTAVEQRRLVQNCKHHGYDFFAIPVGMGDKKVVLINGPVKGSEPVSRDSARRAISLLASILMDNRKLVVSGRLGKSMDMCEDERCGGEIVEIYTRSLIYTTDRLPTRVEVAIANAKVAGKLRINGDGITAENIQELITARENESMKILLSMGFRCKFSAPKSSKFNLASIRKQWLSIQSGECVISGGVSSLDDTTKHVIGEAVRIQNERLSGINFDAAVDSVSSKMGIGGK